MQTSKNKSVKRSFLGKTPDERHEERREKFLVAGKVIFGDRGFQDAKVRDICAEAGLTERYYYETFGSLPKLYEAVYYRELAVLQGTLDKVVATGPREPEVMALALLRAYYSLLFNDQRLARILIIDIYGAASNIRELYKHGIQEFSDRFGLLAAFGLKSIDDKKLDDAMISTALIGTASSLAMRWFIGGYQEPMESVVTNCYAIFLAVIRMSQSGESFDLPTIPN